MAIRQGATIIPIKAKAIIKLCMEIVLSQT